MDSDSYGLNYWHDLFLPRQMICLINLTKAARAARTQMAAIGIVSELADTVQTYLGLLGSKMAQRNNTMCAWDLTSAGGRLGGAFAKASPTHGLGFRGGESGRRCIWRHRLGSGYIMESALRKWRHNSARKGPSRYGKQRYLLRASPLMQSSLIHPITIALRTPTCLTFFMCG